MTPRLAVVGLLALAGCGSSSHAAADAGPGDGFDASIPCADIDLDGFTAATCGGEDCDDYDASVHTAADCEARCGADGHAATCPCTDEAAEACYSGPDGTAGVGACFPGRRECWLGRWSACEGEATPQLEECNDLDDDCDGQVDEEVQSMCGDCNIDCQELCKGNRCSEAFGEDEAVALVIDDSGCFVPANGPEGSFELIWFVESVGRWGDVRYEADLPGSSTLQLDVRVGGSLDELSAAKWTPLGTAPGDASPLDLGIAVDADSFLAVRGTLRAPDGRVARVCRIAVTYSGIIFF